VNTSADTSLTELSGASTVTTDAAHCVKMHFVTDSAALGYRGESDNGSVLVEDHDRNNADAALELLCSTYTAVSTADIVTPFLATTLPKQPACDGVADDDGGGDESTGRCKRDRRCDPARP
jgi:hypothetical protein